jgi:hypothetical protein
VPRVVVEARDVAKALAARFDKGFMSFLRDLFQRLQAIHRKTRADHVYRLDA